MASLVLNVQDATLILGARTIIDGVSLGVSIGQWLSIVGANEAGKTTLLHLLAGWRAPTSGQVEFNGAQLRSNDRVQVVLAPGPDDLPGHLLGSELLAIVRQERRRPLPADWDTILTSLNADRWLDRPIHQLSLGTRRKVALASALIANPTVLLLDEAFDALDAQSSVRIRATVRALVDGGTMAVISASHAWESVFSDSDAIAFLASGRVVRHLERAEFSDLAAQSEKMQATILAAFATDSAR
jgi:ABC-2 type transport system ATP-binding protein